MPDRFFPQFVLRNRLINKAIRVVGRSQPARLFAAFGEPGSHRLTRMGSEYGGWFVPADQIDKDWIVYSLGVGQDITFDTALIGRYGVTVHAFDPTPHAVEFVARLQHEGKLPRTFVFEPVAVWDSDGKLTLYEPKTRGWIGSYSALNLQGTSVAIDVPCKQLATLLRERGHDRIDLLKMDIEGAEYRVIRQMLTRRIAVRWLCVEFDQPVPLATTRNLIGELRESGYRLRHVDQWNFTFESDTGR